MVERSLSMREVPGSMPGFSTHSFFFSFFLHSYYTGIPVICTRNAPSLVSSSSSMSQRSWRRKHHFNSPFLFSPEEKVLNTSSSSFCSALTSASFSLADREEWLASAWARLKAPRMSWGMSLKFEKPADASFLTIPQLELKKVLIFQLLNLLWEQRQ